MDRLSDAVKQENRRIRHLRICTDMVVQLLGSGDVSVAEAEKLVRGARTLAANLFPGKEHVFDLIYIPRFRRVYLETGAVVVPEILQEETVRTAAEHLKLCSPV